MVNDALERSRLRLERVERALDAQRTYIQRVPDPDNRHRAETNLMTLLELREAAEQVHGELMRRQAQPGGAPPSA